MINYVVVTYFSIENYILSQKNLWLAMHVVVMCFSTKKTHLNKYNTHKQLFFDKQDHANAKHMIEHIHNEHIIFLEGHSNH